MPNIYLALQKRGSCRRTMKAMLIQYMISTLLSPESGVGSAGASGALWPHGSSRWRKLFASPGKDLGAHPA